MYKCIIKILNEMCRGNNSVFIFGRQIRVFWCIQLKNFGQVGISRLSAAASASHDGRVPLVVAKAWNSGALPHVPYRGGHRTDLPRLTSLPGPWGRSFYHRGRSSFPTGRPVSGMMRAPPGPHHPRSRRRRPVALM